jgi:hypothetical protein
MADGWKFQPREMIAAGERGRSRMSARPCTAMLAIALINSQAGARGGAKAPSEAGVWPGTDWRAGPRGLQRGDGGCRWPMPRSTDRTLSPQRWGTEGRGAAAEEGGSSGAVLLCMQMMRGGRRIRVRIGKNRWIDPRKIVRQVHAHACLCACLRTSICTTAHV